MKRSFSMLFLLIGIAIFSQEKDPYTMGRITMAEDQLTVYEKDSTANAVFLYEYGKTTFHVENRRIVIRTKYYGKVKIFNKEGVDHATISIPLYSNNGVREKVTDIKGLTHNSLIKTGLDKKNVFTEKLSEHWSEVKFTMPNIKDNSIIEYEYTVESPYMFNFKGWEFQGDIPKIYSEFYALVPGNYVYNRMLIGYQKLTKNEAGIKKSCFTIPGATGTASCEELTYAMRDIPAFIDEDYMTSKKNYLSSIKFELSEFKGFDGVIEKYTKRWKDVDKEFRTEKSIGRQLKKVDYLEKQLPDVLLNGENNLAKAKSIYNFIKNHFTWNGKSRLFDEVVVKDAFTNRVGNSTEINISLINALNAVGFDAEIMLLSTRDNGLPTKAYPVMSDFNYAIAKLNIGEQSYLLDATNKAMPFGMLPIRALNSYGRVMNFKEGSYWYDIVAKKNNTVRTILNLEMNGDGDFTGQMYKSYNGYEAMEKRSDVNSLSDDVYLNKMEEQFGIDDNLIIESYENSDLKVIDKPFRESFDITIESNLSGNLLIFNPFISVENNSNPFKLKERQYPVDFAFVNSSQFNLKLKIPENYTVKSLPEKVAYKLPNGGGNYAFSIEEKNNEIILLLRFNIQRSFFAPQEYPNLKEFFNQIIKTQKSLITLEKI
tara:strand:+ start:41403 stop:43367 length:1965 start_codon:yes stop_codon:yes gene_type:complete